MGPSNTPTAGYCAATEHFRITITWFKWCSRSQLRAGVPLCAKLSLTCDCVCFPKTIRAQRCTRILFQCNPLFEWAPNWLKLSQVCEAVDHFDEVSLALYLLFRSVLNNNFIMVPYELYYYPFSLRLLLKTYRWPRRVLQSTFFDCWHVGIFLTFLSRNPNEFKWHALNWEVSHEKRAQKQWRRQFLKKGLSFEWNTFQFDSFYFDTICASFPSFPFSHATVPHIFPLNYLLEKCESIKMWIQIIYKWNSLIEFREQCSI